MVVSVLSVLMAMAMGLTFLGKSLIGIIMGVCVIISAAVMIKHRQIYFNRDTFQTLVTAREVMAMAAMAVIWVIAAYNGLRPDVSIAKALEFMGMMIGGIIIFSALQSQDFQWNKFFAVSTIISAVAGFLMLVRPYGVDLGIEFRSSYGSVLALIMPFAFCLMISDTSPRKYIWWICGFFIIAGIFASDGRTSWVAFGLFTVMVAFLMPMGGVKNRLMTMILFLSLTIAAAWCGIESYKDNVGEQRFESRVNNMISSDRIGSGRLIIWDETLAYIAEKPLLGYGIRAARFLDIKNADDENATVIHVHNAVLEIALETGLLGLVAFFIVIIVFVMGFVHAYIRSNNIDLKPKAMAIFLSCVVYGICSMALTSIFHTWWFLYLVILLILLKKTELELRRK